MQPGSGHVFGLAGIYRFFNQIRGMSFLTVLAYPPSPSKFFMHHPFFKTSPEILESPKQGNCKQCRNIANCNLQSQSSKRYSGKTVSHNRVRSLPDRSLSFIQRLVCIPVVSHCHPCPGWEMDASHGYDSSREQNWDGIQENLILAW